MPREILTASEERYLKEHGKEKLEVKRTADAIANVLMFRSHELPRSLVEHIGREIVKALPYTEPYIDVDDLWIYRGNGVYEHKATHEIRHYP